MKISVTGAMFHQPTTAWTAIYAYLSSGYKWFHIGIDPTASSGNYMELFGSLLGHEWRFKIRTPVTFMDGMRHKDMMPVYVAFTQLQHNLDGRYGWFSPARSKR